MEADRGDRLHPSRRRRRARAADRRHRRRDLPYPARRARRSRLGVAATVTPRRFLSRNVTRRSALRACAVAIYCPARCPMKSAPPRRLQLDRPGNRRHRRLRESGPRESDGAGRNRISAAYGHPMTVRPESLPISFCPAGPPFGFRLVLTVGSGRDSFFLRRLLFNFTDLRGDFSVPTVTPSPHRESDPYPVPCRSPFRPRRRFHFQARRHSPFPVPWTLEDPRIAAGASQTQAVFLRTGVRRAAGRDAGRHRRRDGSSGERSREAFAFASAIDPVTRA